MSSEDGRKLEERDRSPINLPSSSSRLPERECRPSYRIPKKVAREPSSAPWPPLPSEPAPESPPQLNSPLSPTLNSPQPLLQPPPLPEADTKLSLHSPQPNDLYPMSEEYPEELKQLCTPLKCNLCGVEVHSAVQGTTHYTGKVHDKKVRNWLAEYERNRVGAEVPLYCKYCDKNFSSQVTAVSHYIGRKHQNVIKNGLSNGIYRESTGMQRSETMREDKTGRFGIGLGFASSSRPEEGAHRFTCGPCGVSCTSQKVYDTHLAGAKHRKKCGSRDTEPTTTEISTEKKAKEREATISTSSSFLVPMISEQRGDLMVRILSVDVQCTDCDIMFPDIVALVAHLRSQDHFETLNNALTYDCDNCWQSVHGAEGMISHLKTCLRSTGNGEKDVPKDNILDTVLKMDGNILGGGDLSIYRTPSGKYYCPKCNMTLNSPAQYLNHTISKRHKRQ